MNDEIKKYLLLPGWTAVTDGLPEKELDENGMVTLYLCYCKDDYYRLCLWQDNCWLDCDEDDDDPEAQWYEVDDVTHWMPLPPSPNEATYTFPVEFKQPW